jgi:hypothetical protein
MFASDLESLWTIFSAMIVGNNVYVGALTLMLSGTDHPLALELGAPLAGIMTCILWLPSVKRHEQVLDAWKTSALKDESELAVPFRPLTNYLQKHHGSITDKEIGDRFLIIVFIIGYDIIFLSELAIVIFPQLQHFLYKL